MVHTCVDAVIESLSSLQYEVPLTDRENRRQLMHECEVDLRFIKVFLWCFFSWDSDDDDLRSIFTSIESIWENDRAAKVIKKLEYKIRSPMEEWEKVFDILGKRVLLSMKEIKKHCEHLISKSLTYKSLTSHEIQQFLDAIINNMDHLVICFAGEVLPMKSQIQTLHEKLLVFRNMAEFTTACCADGAALQRFNIHVLRWANKAACLAFLFLLRVLNVKEEDFLEVDEEDENYSELDVENEIDEDDYSLELNVDNQCSSELDVEDEENKYSSELDKEDEEDEEVDVELENIINVLVRDLMDKVNPRTPDFIEMCFGVIKLAKFSSSDILFFETFVSNFVDFLLHNLMLSSNNSLGMLREGLTYLMTFHVGSSTAKSGEDFEVIFIQSQIDAVLSEACRVICLLDQAKVVLANEGSVLAELLDMIHQVKEIIDKHCIHIPLTRWSNFPRVGEVGFLEGLLVHLEDLEEATSRNSKCFPSFKNQILTIKNELVSLRPLLQDISELLNEHKELKELQGEINGVMYQAELAIKQSFFIDTPFCLSYVLHKIRAIQSKVMSVKGNKIHTTEIVSSLTSSTDMFRASISTSRVDEEVVGFEEETEVLIDQLTRGTKELDIVSIVGMGGIGKTTLAKKLYKERSVSLYFHKKAFCIISQVYKSRNVLLDILSHLTEIDDNVRNMMEEDLADMLRKSLKGQRYLIVLDDIWNIDVWDCVKHSFPDDHNGSRVMFTTRINEISLKAKPNCSPYALRFLTIEESWDLLQKKVFHKNVCPPFLYETGRSIAENCKGLALSVVVISGLLENRSLPWWQKIAGNLTSYVSSEGCWDILELSYKYLPDALKSCFLYMGALPEDRNIRAGDITRLWVAEGFILKSDRSSMDMVAKEYLNYLCDKSLMLITKRNLDGNIQCCRLHDVLREFCISKAQEEHLLCLVNGENCNISMSSIYDQYRVCVQAECTSFIDANLRGPPIHSLLCFDDGHALHRHGCSLSSLCRNFRLIQVLDLRPVNFLNFPTGITMLVYLRYLALSCGGSHVPPTISNLQNLETFLITTHYAIVHFPSTMVHFPNTIWKIKRLRHLKVEGDCSFDGLDDVASEAFSQLPDLKTVGLVEIRNKEEGEELCRRLPNVRKFSFICEELPENLVNLNKLESLHIWYHDRFVVQNFNLPSTLRKLSLQSFLLPGRELSTMIGKLPFLQDLKLSFCTFGKIWDVEDDEFPGLKCLTLYGIGIRHWNASIDSFPCLEKLVLDLCYNLLEIPPCFGEVPTLRALEIRGCGEIVEASAIRIQEEQLDMGNDSLEFILKK